MRDVILMAAAFIVALIPAVINKIRKLYYMSKAKKYEEVKEMNKKKGLIVGGIAAISVIIIISLILVLMNSGKDKDKNSKETTRDITSVEITTEIEDDTEQTTEEKTTEEKTTEEETTAKKPVEKDEPSEEQLAYREVLKNQIFEVGYDSYKEAYLHMLQVYERAYGYDEKYALVDFDGDDVLELVADVNSGITMYTFKDGKVYKLVDDWGYGAGGNHGYEYITGKSVIRNYNTDYAGIIMYETYWNIKLSGENVVEDISYLKQTFFDDVNGNGVPDDNEEVSDEYVRYYLGDKEVNVDEYVGAMIEGEYKNLQGEMDLYDIYRVLQKPDLVKIKDKKCREAYLQIIEQFEKDTEEDMSRSYALIDFDGDDTLELICQRGGHRISFYVYEDGNVYQLMDDWSWGAGANHGYEYIPGKNIYKNNDSNAGENIVTFKKLNDNNKLELMYYLVVEWGEYKKDGIDRYYKGTQDGEVEITEAEYKELMIEGNFRLIEAWYSREEIESCLR